MWLGSIESVKRGKYYWIKEHPHGVVRLVKCRDVETFSHTLSGSLVWVHESDAHPSTIDALNALSDALESLNEHEKAAYIRSIKSWVVQLRFKDFDMDYLLNTENHVFDESKVNPEILSWLDVVSSSVFTGDSFIEGYGRKPSRDYLSRTLKEFYNYCKRKNGA